MTDGMRKHLTTMTTDEDEAEDEEEDELAARRRDLVNLVDSYNEHMRLSRVDAPTGAPPHVVIAPSQQHALTRHPSGGLTLSRQLIITPPNPPSPLCSDPGARDEGGCAQGHPRRRACG